MKKILFSLAALVIVSSLGIGATNAIFSDNEVSSGNTFTTGAIDLTIDNESYYNGKLNASTTWLQAANLDDGNGPSDNGKYLFFNFGDVKPGDWGEDTISLHVNNNDSWLCMDVTLTGNDDNGITEPESGDGDTTDGVGNGELLEAMKFMWWADDGDNVFEDGEELFVFDDGNGNQTNSFFTNAQVGDTVTLALADSQNNVWEGSGPLPGDVTRFIGKAWCLGDMTPNPVAQDGLGKTTNGTTSVSTNGPLVRGTGFTCDGSPVDNVTQTDTLTADIAFYTEQSRNNGNFICAPLPPQETTVTIKKEVINDNGGTATVADFSFLVGSTTVHSGETVNIDPGTYTISESGPDGYNVTFGGDCDANGNITISEFDQAVCTITNDDKENGVLLIDKLVTFSGPSLNVSTSDFNFTVTNTVTNEVSSFTDEVPGDLPAGDYTIDEVYTGNENISYTSTFSVDCSDTGNNTASISITEGATSTCQIINIINSN